MDDLLTLFIDNAEQVMPAFFNATKTSPVQRKHYTEYVLQLTAQKMMEDVADKLESNLSVNILYCTKSGNGQQWEMVGYSTPAEDSMYIITASSYAYGLTEEVHILFFPSIEYMWKQIDTSMRSFAQQKEDAVTVIRQLPPQKVYKHFI